MAVSTIGGNVLAAGVFTININVASSNVLAGFDSEGNTGWGLYVDRPYNVATGYVENNTRLHLETGSAL